MLDQDMIGTDMHIWCEYIRYNYAYNHIIIWYTYILEAVMVLNGPLYAKEEEEKTI